MPPSPLHPSVADRQNLLDQLRPNHLPDPVSWWPPAIGWWLLGGGLVLTAVALSVWFILRYLKKNHYRKQALKQAATLYAAFQQHKDARRFAHDCNSLLKKTALIVFPTQQPAQLHSDRWLAFLTQTSGMSSFTEQSGAVFGSGKYQQDCPVDAEQTYALTQSWIREHHA